MAAYVSLRRSRQTLFPNSRTAGAINPPGIVSLTVRVCSAAILVLGAMTAMALAAQTSVWAANFKIVHSFDGTDGEYAQEGLVQATNGYLYGTTSAGGAYDGGTVFKLNPLSGTLTTLYNFCSASGCTDGEYPEAPALIQATNGNLYGTTEAGGVNNAGTIFQITPSGTVTTLYSFCPLHVCPNGEYPGALVQATIGRFYVTRFYGTTYGGGPSGDGTVFIFTSNGTFKTIHSFDGTDGIIPQGLLQATNGNFYGTTAEGAAYGAGTVFEMTANGTLTTLHNFCSEGNCTDGGDPLGGLLQATNGNFYGTTAEGGLSGHDYGGTVFEITPNGALTTLYKFCSEANCADGAIPEAALLQATNGNFYGTTAGIPGTVFRITPKGVMTTLHRFCSQNHCADGNQPQASLIQASSNGMLYGTTSTGGAYHVGTVFEITP
jgi:uncharacterized repeat protein (TIGR03803 family)